MATNGGGEGPWEVRCSTYYKRFKTEARAEAWRDRVEDESYCREQHTVTNTEEET